MFVIMLQTNLLHIICSKVLWEKSQTEILIVKIEKNVAISQRWLMRLFQRSYSHH